jgi:iron complex outermembrane recepter protein
MDYRISPNMLSINTGYTSSPDKNDYFLPPGFLHSLLRILLILVMLFFVSEADGQPRKSGKVKRKYREVEVVNEKLPEVFVHGRVRNLEREPVQGATVVVRGSRIHVNTNEYGEYFLKGLTTGVNSIMVSCMGYETKIIDFYLQEGKNDVYFTLDREQITLEPHTITAQKREQHPLEIPFSQQAVSGKMIETFSIRDMEQVAGHIPGFQAVMQAPHQPIFSMRGITSQEAGPGTQPRIAVYFNQVPVSGAGISVTEIYDLERIEVLKGPQGTLFGHGGQIGAVSFVTKQPDMNPGGYITAGMGEFNRQELQGAINLPLVDNKLAVRFSGLYDYYDGYVGNTFGGTLNGKNTLAGRFSLKAAPSVRTRVGLVINYQKDDNPGTAYMNRQFPNTNGISDIFKYQASLDPGNSLYNRREVLGSSLDIKHFRNENTFWSSLSSFYMYKTGTRWDGDGTQAPALDNEENTDAWQLSQEIRYNFSRKSRTNGFVGAGYLREDVRQTNWIRPNEQHMAYLYLNRKDSLIGSDGSVIPMIHMPDDSLSGGLAGLLLPALRQEENASNAVNQTIDVFGDATLKIRPRLSFTVGIRGAWENFKVTNESRMTGNTPSVLGAFTGNQPNLFYKPSGPSTLKKNALSYTWRSNLRFDLNSYSSIYMGYSKGRRPYVVRYMPDGNGEVTDPEVIHNFEGGFKWSAMQRFWVDASAFYLLCRNFQAIALDSLTGRSMVSDAGKATSYGLEASMKAVILKGVEFFGNYAYVHARFDSLDSKGYAQEYGGNSFRFTPEHSFSAGIDLRMKLALNLGLFVTPSYSWKSHFYFDDSNVSGLEQDAYGLLNVRAGLELYKPALTIAFYGSNLLEEKYVLNAGNSLASLGIPSFIPGAPRMAGLQLTWKF